MFERNKESKMVTFKNVREEDEKSGREEVDELRIEIRRRIDNMQKR